MKILFLQDDFPPYSYGGAGLVVFNLAKGLQKKGHQIFIISTRQNKSLPEEEIYQGIKVFRIYSHYHERWRAYLGLFNPQAIRQVRKIIQEINPEIIHAHNVHYYLSYYSLKIAKRHHCPVFLTVHDVMSFHYGKLIEFIDKKDLSIPKYFNYQITPWQQIKRFKKRYNPFRNVVIRHYLKSVDKIFAVSQTLKEALIQNKIKNVAVIYNGIDIDQWQFNNEQVEKFIKKYGLLNKKIIFLAGRVNHAKGGEAILSSFSLINQKIKDSVLLIAARQDKYIQKIIRQAKGLGLEKNIIPTGWLAQEELKAAYFASNLAVSPSLCLDTFNMVNIEAMAAKKPVVGTCFGGTPEIVVDNQTGYIVNPLNPEIMAEKIIDLLVNSQKAEHFGQVGYQRVKENFSLEKQVEKTLNWYQGKFGS